MLKKRIIPCLDVCNGRTVKGVNFVDLKDAGDPVELAQKYSQEGADELMFLDITATVEKRKTLVSLVKKIAERINIPFTVGGGINSLDKAKEIIQSGADKISLNTAAVLNPGLITNLANTFGSQAVVVAIDAKYTNGNWYVATRGGRNVTTHLVTEWAMKVERYGAGELLLTSMEADGTKNGFSISLTEQVCKVVNIPVIASGGAGKKQHFKDVFKATQVSAALAASVFHFGEIELKDLKKYLSDYKIPIRWN